MAKRTASKQVSKKPTTRRRQPSDRTSVASSRVGFKEFFSSPAVKYIAGGIASAILTKVANNLVARYPEISRFLSENLEGVEGRLADFKSSLDGRQESAARH